MFYYLNCVNQIKWNGKWIDIGYFPKGENKTENGKPHIENFEFSKFSDLQKFAESFYGLINSRSLFGREKIKVQLGLSSHFFITEKNVQNDCPCQLRRVWTDDFTPTMDWLLENVSAEDFVQYAKDRNWNNISIGK